MTLRTDRRGVFAFIGVLLLVLVPAYAVDHTRSVGEPYSLAGKRMVFIGWDYVRPGQIDWLDASGKSIYAASVEAGPNDAHFQNYLAPRGIRLIAMPAKRAGPIVAREMPWEKMGINGTSLIHEDGKYRLWGGSQKSKDQSFHCYFESTDGKTWTRPNLGLVEYDGSKSNNLFKNPGSYVFRDPNAPPAERYKALWAARADPKIIPEYRRTRPISVFAEEEDPGRFHSIKAAVSPDGFNWTELEKPVSVEVSDTQIVAYFDEQLKRYVMFTRAQMLGARAAGQPRPEGRMHDFIGRRAIGRSESTNFYEFPLSDLIIQTTADMAPTDTFYTNCKTTIPGAPDHHLLFPAIYHQADDTTSIEVWSSFDTKSWTRLPDSPVLGTNTPGQFDGGCIFAHPSLVELPDGTWALPYTGYVYPHKYPRGAWGYDIGMATWPKGRLIALEAAEEGEFTTVAFVPPGKRVLINAVTERAGHILVEACDIHAKPLSGCSFDDARPVIGDQYRSALSWKAGETLAVKDGEPIVLRFRMNKAKLFGLDFE
jgi:hypothetical protein